MNISKSFFSLLLCSIIVCAMSCDKNKNGGDDVIKPVEPSIKYIDTFTNKPFNHEGALFKQADIDRIKAKIADGKEPWLSGWNRLITNSHAQLSYTPNPTVKLIRGGGTREEPLPDNYSAAMNDAAAAFQLAVRWRISGDNAYAQKAIDILNIWASKCVTISGDSNGALAAGLYGNQFALAGEILRNYSGWAVQDFTKFKQWMLDVFYAQNVRFISTHYGQCATHPWANWDICNLASVMAIGILTDNRTVYNYAVNYLQRGNGNGNLLKAIYYVHPDGTAQLQESGRDQGHATLCIALVGLICEMAWHQGDDFYGFDNNRFLKACEYTAKYNVANLNVLFEKYIRYWNTDCREEIYTEVSASAKGSNRPMWEMPYNHYVKRKGLTANFTQLASGSLRPEGGGGDYGSSSGGFDQLGFGTLLFSLD